MPDDEAATRAGYEDATDELALIERANLPESDTGIPGWIYVSSQQGNACSAGELLRKPPGAPCAVHVGAHFG